MVVNYIKFNDTEIEFIDGDRGIHYPKKEEFSSSGYCVFLNTGNVTSNGFNFNDLDFITKEKDELLRKGRVIPHDIVLTTRGTVGNVAYVSENELYKNIRINSGMVIIRSDCSKYEPYFLYSFFRSELFKKQCEYNGSGSAQPQLPISALKNISFPNFNLETQQKIAQVLSTLDRKIALNQQISAKLEKMAKTLYDYWFVQFDFPDENGNPYKSSGGEMVYNPELKRDVPKGWECDFVENYLDKVPNTDKIPSKEIQVKGQIPVIDQSQDYICGFTDNENALLEPIDAHIIFGDHTRVVKLVNFPYARGADGTQIIISNNKKLPNFLFYQMIAKIDLSNYGYARHYKFLKESKVLIPTEYIAQKYHQTVKPYFDLWKTNLKETQKLTQLRDFLLPMLMNGQVEVV
ncbi:type I restriction-modification system, S subunit [Actinobacillus pleuropneumoniae]|uniref:Putative type I restriction-modification system, S subunit n=1 Tax=Actinobacillus pleuropneumoniae serotype 5b (strain L20) TaxID=416269 RepID=A3N1J5_ACTP2|nr:restriction endonuclease subunit S [Actinobacillus pleuropneumoniae]ABN74281.1 putative type I restriction-modification system, S subunit [Actinobacillus pleuropneumoniae serovar 5b str. L20]MEE3683584.1 restriction endonuclease subunit S [Actinobacillus pleuropneumoniae]QSZ39236.1 type I restriction-modification system, S subunit [Actinobacillus pleuropneumoniae]UKH10606.1 restriction endonuclease subunit S [Actinobacillus pleuropneumoniae]UKH20329.1 restriction endonuclease subunit S [Act